MTLRDALLGLEEELQVDEVNNVEIDIRVVLPKRFKLRTVLVGACKYLDGYIISFDDNRYTLEDTVNGWKYDKNQDTLVIFKESGIK